MAVDYLKKIEEGAKVLGIKSELNENVTELMNPDQTISKGLNRTLVLEIPEERQFKKLLVVDDKNVKDISESKFLAYRFINGYFAIWSSLQETIECEIDYDINNYELTHYRLTNAEFEFVNIDLIFNYNLNSIPKPESKKEVYTFPSLDKNITITIGKPSYEFLVMQVLQRNNYNANDNKKLTIKIKGVDIGTHDKAKELLIKISNTALFQFDLSTGTSIRLLMDRRMSTSPAMHFFSERKEITNTRFEYDEETMALYLYGRSAAEMPLLQYLAFYQVLEFYFPIYSNSEAQQKIKNIIKDPLLTVLVTPISLV